MMDLFKVIFIKREEREKYERMSFCIFFLFKYYLRTYFKGQDGKSWESLRETERRRLKRRQEDAKNLQKYKQKQAIEFSLPHPVTSESERKDKKKTDVNKTIQKQ